MFLVALAAGLVVLEWVLRRNVAHFLGTPAASAFLYEMDGERSFRLVRGFRGEQSVDGRTTTIHVNARGMRGPEVSAKRDGEVRVLVLGDSLVFGHGVADGEAIPSRLEHHLRAGGRQRVTVGNAGVPGYGTIDFARGMLRHRDFAPDLVVACTYLGNDFADDCRQHSAVVEGYLLHGALGRVAHTSTRFRWTLRYRCAYLLENLLTRFAPALAFDRTQLASTPEEVEAFALFPPEEQRFAGLFFDRRADDALVAKVLGRCRASYLALREQAGDRPVLHVLIPTWWHLSKETWAAELAKLGFASGEHEHGAAQRRLLALAAELGLDMVDLTPMLSEAADRDALWLPVDRHLSAAGCDRVAAWLAPHVERHLGR